MVFRKRWPKRREFLAYYALLRVFRKNTFSLTEAVDVLYPFIGSRRVASRLVRRLVKQGFLERVAPQYYRAKDVEELLSKAMLEYFASRLRRRGFCAEPMQDKIIVYCAGKELENNPLIEVKSCENEEEKELCRRG